MPTAAGTDGTSTSSMASDPRATPAKPAATNRDAPNRSSQRAWSHDAAVQVRVAAVRAMPATAAVRPRTVISA